MTLCFAINRERVDPELVLTWALRLCYQPHPHLPRFVRAHVESDQLWLEVEPLRAIPLGEYLRTVTPEARIWATWARQLASLGRFLVELGLPVGPATFRSEHLYVASAGLVLADPGLTELAERGEGANNLAGALQAYGSMLRHLAGEALPADLVWIVARCLQSGQDTGYPNFEQLERALEAALTVLPGQDMPAMRHQRPSIKGFTLPLLAAVPRFPWSRLLLGLCLMGTLVLLAWQWWSSPPPVRHYPAALLLLEQELLIVDLSSPTSTPPIRQRLRLPSPLLMSHWLGNTPWLVCRDSRRALVLDPGSLVLSESCAIDPNPADMRADPAHRHLYLLYPKQGRALVIRRPGSPLAYLTLAEGAERLLPLSSEQLVVYNQHHLWSHSVPLRMLQWEQELPSFDGLAVGGEGHLWLLRDNRVLALEPQKGTPAPTEVLTLSASGTQLMARGDALLVAQPKGVERISALGPSRFVPLGGAPLVMVGDLHRSDRLWVQLEARLIQLDLNTGTPLSSWQLPRGSRLLGVLP